MRLENIERSVAHKQMILIFVFATIPLLYVNDGGHHRAWEVLAVGVISSIISVFLTEIKIGLTLEWAPLILYCFVLIAQQLFIPQGSVVFGAQYAIVMVAAFLPPSIVRMVKWHEAALTVGWARAIQLLAAVMIVNVFGSHYLGFGEVHESMRGMRGMRSFGFLGDSSAPLSVFLIIYFILEKKWIWAAAMIMTLFFMGSAASLAMLSIIFVILMNLRNSRPVRFAILVACLLAGAFLQPYISENLLEGALEYSWNNRMLSYQVGWDVFRHNPVWGIGINQTMLDIQLQGRELARSIGVTNYYDLEQVANSFIRSLAETGILGCTAFLWICYILIRRAFSDMDRFIYSPNSQARSLVIAGGVWVVAFIVGYQTVGWFEHGHPQLSLLLMISAMTTAVAARSSVPFPRHERLPGGG
jgi:O-antigen ligase